ncbi:MAG: purine-nucleoside phosphorylase [Chloroflexi bacterium]|nr:purine-nucleoside phosphorylase [Chloroflexota bacterium]
MNQLCTRDDLSAAVNSIREHCQLRPRIACILGSGLSALAERVEADAVIPYSEIPYFPSLSVAGHAGRLVLGHIKGIPIAFLQGRAHYYEGYEFSDITWPIRVLRLLGVDTLLLTNAAGGIHRGWDTGDIVLITDHINIPGLAGNNPLRGPNDDSFGPRFPAMSAAYDTELINLARESANRLNISLREGVYAMVGGPNFETPAEIRLLRAVGADVVGMSTVPEVLVGRHSGMRILGLSYISNIAVDSSSKLSHVASHAEVLNTGAMVLPRLAVLIEEIIQHI